MAQRHAGKPAGLRPDDRGRARRARSGSAGVLGSTKRLVFGVSGAPQVPVSENPEDNRERRSADGRDRAQNRPIPGIPVASRWTQCTAEVVACSGVSEHVPGGARFRAMPSRPGRSQVAPPRQQLPARSRSEHRGSRGGSRAAGAGACSTVASPGPGAASCKAALHPSFRRHSPRSRALVRPRPPWRSSGARTDRRRSTVRRRSRWSGPRPACTGSGHWFLSRRSPPPLPGGRPSGRQPGLRP